MTNNFLNFIEEDIEAKKKLLSVMPTNTKTDKRKYNEKLESLKQKYEEYRINVRNYVVTKSRSFKVKQVDKNKDVLTKKIAGLEHVKFVLNPTNTYFEKMGFDNLLYEISNYTDFDFDFMNNVINELISKFELVGIKLKDNDFNFTYYVNKYMAEFLKLREQKSTKYDSLAPIFEQIYWENPDLVDHIKLNFRALIRKNERRFTKYINKVKKEITTANNVKTYDECLEKLKKLYIELEKFDEESVSDIIDLACEGTIDISQYLEESKIRQTTYETLMIEPDKKSDATYMEKFYDTLKKLKSNVNEYSSYLKFLPIMQDFQKEYAKQPHDGGKTSLKELKRIMGEINSKEKKLKSLNKKLFIEMKIKHKKLNDDLAIESVNIAKELSSLHTKYDNEYFKEKVLKELNDSFTITELLHLYYSFDYFKKTTIKKVFKLTDYNELMNLSDTFDLFAMNPNNVIINGIVMFQEINVAEIIMNKYRINGINLSEENISENELEVLLDKINLMLRINQIEKSEITIEKIWFMAKIKKFLELESNVTEA